MKKTIIFIFIAIMTINTYAASGGDLFRIGLTGPSMILPESYSGVTSAGNNVFYNPAVASLGNAFELNTRLGVLSYDRTYNFVNITGSLEGIGSLGLSYAQIGVQNIPTRDEYGTDTGNINYQDSAIALSYGLNIIKQLDLGINIKYLMTSLGSVQASGFGLDIGAVYAPIDEGFLQDLRLGISICDAFTIRSWPSGATVYPMTVRLSAFSSFFSKKLMFGVDFEVVSDISANLFSPNNMEARFGFLYMLLQDIYVGAGISTALDYNFTLAYAPPTWYKIDYKMVGDSFGVNHWITLEFKFGETGRFQAARNERITKVTPKDEMTAHYIKAVELYSAEDYEKALEETRAVLKIQPDYKPAIALQKDISKALKARIKDITARDSTVIDEGTEVIVEDEAVTEEPTDDFIME